MTTTSDTVLLDISERVATVTLNRPEKLNALNSELMDALPPIIGRLALTSSYAALLDAEAEGMIMAAMTEDNREAIRAFLEKRPATFQGR